MRPEFPSVVSEKANLGTVLNDVLPNEASVPDPFPAPESLPREEVEELIEQALATGMPDPLPSDTAGDMVPDLEMLPSDSDPMVPDVYPDAAQAALDDIQITAGNQPDFLDDLLGMF